MNIMATNSNIILNAKEKSLVDALWNLYILQSDKVRKAFHVRIENDRSEEKVDGKETDTQLEVKESLTRAYDELLAEKAKHNARNLFL
jgi:hypothetical protein